MPEELQRLGLSANVSNPGEVLAWVPGSSQREQAVVGSASPVQGEQLAFATYEDLDAAVREAVGAERALVFIGTRRRAEELGDAVELPRTTAPSGRRELRSAALAALAEGHKNAVVATATLKMGIDVGDLDLVVQWRSTVVTRQLSPAPRPVGTPRRQAPNDPASARGAGPS